MLQVRVQESGGQLADQKLPFLLVKKRLLLVLGLNEDGSSSSALLQFAERDTFSLISYLELSGSLPQIQDSSFYSQANSRH